MGNGASVSCGRGRLGAGGRGPGRRLAGGGGAGAGAGGVGRADWAVLDVGEGHRSVGRVGLDIGGRARSGSACSSCNTWGRGGTSGGVVAVEPQHLCCVIVPERLDWCKRTEYH